VAAFVGQIEQVPPAYSAVKVAGERLYRAARRGEAVAAPPRLVLVEAFDLRGFEPPSFAFGVVCSAGTYVRTLVADAGTRLGCGAHLTRLRRTAIGPFRVGDARPPDDPGAPADPAAALGHLAGVAVTDEEAVAVSHGRVLGPAGIDGPYRVHGPGGALIGIYHDEGPKAVPDVVLAPA
jgi:tRNA pseudouridine55 synthase